MSLVKKLLPIGRHLVKGVLFNHDDEIDIDNFVCRLHNSVTTVILLAFSIILSIEQVRL